MSGRRDGKDPRKGNEATRPFTVLIVDDDADVRMSLRELFESDRPPCLALVSASGPDGLDLLAGAPVDAILADYRMVPMNGLDFLVEARKRAPNVARLMITAYPDMKLTIDAANEGRIEHFFLKPVNPAELLQVVRGLRLQRDEALGRAQAFARGLDKLRRQSRLRSPRRPA